MKKYTKPAIEIVEANLSGDYLQDLSGSQGGGQSGEYLSSGKKDKGEDLDFDDEGW